MKFVINFLIATILIGFVLINSSCSKNADMKPLEGPHAVLKDTITSLLQSSSPISDHLDLKKNHYGDKIKDIEPFVLPDGYSLQKKGRTEHLIRITEPAEVNNHYANWAKNQIKQ